MAPKRLTVVVNLAISCVRRNLALTFFLFLGLPALLGAQGLPATEKQKIEALIKAVGQTKDAKFVRNGWSYNSENAAKFLKGKWDANAAEVKSARDFIEKVASFSGTSGKPYLIRFNDGKEMRSQEFLLAELKRIETAQ